MLKYAVDFKNFRLNFMREIIQFQPSLGSTNIGDLKIDSNSRDDIPDILKGLQHIYVNHNLRDSIMAVVQKVQ